MSWYFSTLYIIKKCIVYCRWKSLSLWDDRKLLISVFHTTWKVLFTIICSCFDLIDRIERVLVKRISPFRSLPILNPGEILHFQEVASRFQEILSDVTKCSIQKNLPSFVWLWCKLGMSGESDKSTISFFPPRVCLEICLCCKFLYNKKSEIVDLSRDSEYHTG